jgi:very-short-patch-repair endonuclease
VAAYAQGQANVISRRQVRGLGVTRWEVEAELRAGRWRAVGRQAVSLHTGPLSDEARLWVAVFEAGPRAYVDGESALVAAGLKGYEPRSIRITIPRGATPYRRMPGVDIRQSRRWDPADTGPGRLPCSRVEVAAVRAALWARSDRQAALLLTMVVQQRLTTAEKLAIELLRIKRDRRRAFARLVVNDLLGGVRSLGELDVVRACRRRGIPEPSKQVLRRTPNGTYYLDLLWERWGIVVEVDGIQHSWASQIVGDAVRQNAVSIKGKTVLRLPLLGLRVDPDTFFAQIQEALVAAGCPIAA